MFCRKLHGALEPSVRFSDILVFLFTVSSYSYLSRISFCQYCTGKPTEMHTISRKKNRDSCVQSKERHVASVAVVVRISTGTHEYCNNASNYVDLPDPRALSSTLFTFLQLVFLHIAHFTLYVVDWRERSTQEVATVT